MPKRRIRGVSVLFPHLGVQGFRADHWPIRGLTHHGDPSRLSELIQAPQLADVEGLIRGHDAIHLLGVRDDGVFVQTPVSGRQGHDLYSLGSSLMLDRVERRAPVIAQWVDALANDLGLERSGCYCQALLSPVGCVVPKHFDGVEVMVVQIHGEKRWRVGPNDDVRFPMWQWFPGRPLGPLRRIGPSSYDDTPPSKRVRMRPGSALFVPRGHWHQTTTPDKASLSLSFIVPAPTWFELLMPLLRQRLLDDERWRAPQPYRADAVAFRRDARAMLEALGDEILRIAPHELAPRMDLGLHPSTHLKQRDGATFELGGRGAPIRINGPAGSVTLGKSDIPRSIRDWVAVRAGEFRVRDVIAANANVSPALVVDALETLIRRGYLEPVS